MEDNAYVIPVYKDSPELPALLKKLSSDEVAGFDTINNEITRLQPSDSPQVMERKTPGLRAQINESESGAHQRTHSVSISMPSSPSKVNELKRVCFSIDDEGVSNNGVVDSSGAPNTEMKHLKRCSFSQPISKGYLFSDPDKYSGFPISPSIRRLKDKRFDSFKTWSGKLERQITNLRGRPLETERENDVELSVVKNLERSMPVARYFDALEGPELDTLRDQEEIVLPGDKTWPFLLRFPISSFGICLGVSSQAIMWKTLATTKATHFLSINPYINTILWYISISLTITVASIYLLKVVFFYEAVLREYYHPIRVNFFFAPWIALLFLALGVPPSITTHLPPALWYVLMVPFLFLEVKIYGQWMSGGQRRLSKVANPSNHLSVVGNFVGSLLGASMGLIEGPIFFFSIGLAHYLVLFVTLYQRLPTNETLPKELHPVFFLFVAAPSVASMAWAKINGSFDYGARIAYFIALFLYFTLAVRVNFFRGFKFSLAWWAYTFPMTGAAIATIKYSDEVTNIVTQALSVILCAISMLTVTALLVSTIIHAFVLRDLFPNDIAIAISERKPKHHSWFQNLRPAGNSGNVENFLKFVNSDGKELEAFVTLTSAGTGTDQV